MCLDLFSCRSSESEAKWIFGICVWVWVISFSLWLLQSSIELLFLVIVINILLLLRQVLWTAVSVHSLHLLNWLELVALEQAALGSLLVYSFLGVVYLVVCMSLGLLGAPSFTKRGVEVRFLCLKAEVVGWLRVLKLGIGDVLNLIDRWLVVLSRWIGVDWWSTTISSLSDVKIQQVLSSLFTLSSINHVEWWKRELWSFLFGSLTPYWVVKIKIDWEFQWL